MNKDTATSLRNIFGYIPDEAAGEQWTVYRNHTLIVVHPDRLPRIYEHGCAGSFIEIDVRAGGDKR